MKNKPTHSDQPKPKPRASLNGEKLGERLFQESQNRQRRKEA
jgi:hypothetical protein